MVILDATHDQFETNGLQTEIVEILLCSGGATRNPCCHTNSELLEKITLRNLDRSKNIHSVPAENGARLKRCQHADLLNALGKSDLLKNLIS